VKTVAFQGEPGAYSEGAALQFFGEKTKADPYKDFKDVFDSVCTQKNQVWHCSHRKQLGRQRDSEL